MKQETVRTLKTQAAHISLTKTIISSLVTMSLCRKTAVISDWFLKISLWE